MSAQLNVVTTLLTETQRSFQIGAGLLFAGYLFSLIRPLFSFCTLTGAQLVRFEGWRLVTHFLFERNPLLLLFSLYCLYRASILFEPVWGVQELIKFFGIAQILSSFLVAVVSLVTYMIIRDDFFFFDVQIYGSAALSVGVLVAIKQYLPDSILLTTPICRFKNTHLPAIAIFFGYIAATLGILRWVAVLQMVLGIQIAWMYLRFYQYHDDGEPKGDSSEHFAWATLFPSKVQPCMNAIASTIFAILVKLRVCKPVIRRIDISRLDSISILPTSQSKEAERKRQKAIRDLTERLSRSQRDDTGNWPEMDIGDDEAELKQIVSFTKLDSCNTTIMQNESSEPAGESSMAEPKEVQQV